METSEYKIMFEAEERHWWYVSLHSLILHFIAEERKSKDHLKILDAGCGTGRLCQLMAPFGAVHGCDVSDDAVSFCKKRYLPSIFKADLNTVLLGENRYDVITSIDVLYHRGIENEERVLKKFFDALLPGGMLILQVPAYEFLRSSHDAAVHTRKRYTTLSLVKLLRSSGFAVQKITYRVTVLFFPIAVYRILQKTLTRSRARGKARSDVSIPVQVVNKLLLLLSLLENLLLRRAAFPFGTSVFAVARKRPVSPLSNRNGEESS